MKVPHTGRFTTYAVQDAVICSSKYQGRCAGRSLTGRLPILINGLRAGRLQLSPLANHALRTADFLREGKPSTSPSQASQGRHWAVTAPSPQLQRLPSAVPPARMGHYDHDGPSIALNRPIAMASSFSSQIYHIQAPSASRRKGQLHVLAVSDGFRPMSFLFG